MRAFLLALVLLTLFVPLSPPLFTLLERPFIRELLAQPFSEKDQGMQIQHEALQRQDVMPVHGSSELLNEMGMRADEFFRQKPTGFQVCPVGAAGNTCLMMAQKIAAQGEALRGHKMAFILSHTWFRRPETLPGQVEGNFSPLQAISLLQDPALGDALRRRYAGRLLDYPKLTAAHPLIGAYVRSLVEQGPMAEVKKAALNPLLRLQRIWLSFEDHLNTLEAIFKYEIVRRAWWTEKVEGVSWPSLIEDKEREVPDEQRRFIASLARLNDGANDETFLDPLRTAKEWDDFALLLDTLKVFKAEPLIITVPLPGPRLNYNHVSRGARDSYYQRIASMCHERGFPAETFSSQDLAVNFLAGSGTHLEVKGWIYVDQLLDQFFHNRLPASTGAGKR